MVFFLSGSYLGSRSLLWEESRVEVSFIGKSDWTYLAPFAAGTLNASGKKSGTISKISEKQILQQTKGIGLFSESFHTLHFSIPVNETIELPTTLVWALVSLPLGLALPWAIVHSALWQQLIHAQAI